MFKNRTPLEKLKNQHPYVLDGLPPSIRIDGEAVATENASVDQIAFAILATENEFHPISRRLRALRELYDLARKRGALGAESIAEAFARLEVRP